MVMSQNKCNIIYFLTPHFLSLLLQRSTSRINYDVLDTLLGDEVIKLFLLDLFICLQDIFASIVIELHGSRINQTKQTQ